MSRLHLLRRFIPGLRNTKGAPGGPQNERPEDDGFVPEDYPNFPPPSPRPLLEAATEYWQKVQARKFAAPESESADAPLFALYRLYEAFILDERFAYRNELEEVWRNGSPAWRICEIPDPADPDLERYTFLAGVTYLMVKSFNKRVELGLVRGAKPLMSVEEAEEAKLVPLHQRPWERVPQWAEDVSPLSQTLVIPTSDGEILSSTEDKRADPDLLKKNILIWTPHIHFT